MKVGGKKEKWVEIMKGNVGGKKKRKSDMQLEGREGWKVWGKKERAGREIYERRNLGQT